MAEKKETTAPEPRELHLHCIDIEMPDNDNDGIKRVLWTISHALWAILAALVILAIVGLTTRPAHGADAKLYTVPVADSSLIVEAAVEHAARHHEPCYILVGASWCGPCRQVESLYVSTLQKRGTYLHLDQDHHARWIVKLGVAIRALPTLIVIEGAKRRVYVGLNEIKLFLEGR